MCFSNHITNYRNRHGCHKVLKQGCLLRFVMEVCGEGTQMHRVVGVKKGFYFQGAGRNQSQYKARGHKQQLGQGRGKVARTRAGGKTRKSNKHKTKRGGASKPKEINKQRTDILTRAETQETNKHRKIHRQTDSHTGRFTHRQINTSQKLQCQSRNTDSRELEDREACRHKELAKSN